VTGRAAAAVLGLAVLGSAWAEPASYAIDPTHTFVSFEVLHYGTSTNRGRFDKKEGTVVLDRVARTGGVEISIDMNSINTGVAALNSVLKGKDYFDTANFPTARYAAERLVFDGAQVTAVEGTLTLLGKAVVVVLKATHFNCYLNPLLKREVCGGDFEAAVQPSAWGITRYIPAVAPDRARLVVQVEAVRQ
jgi:polyisoprenoid-binding protein YceI